MSGLVDVSVNSTRNMFRTLHGHVILISRDTAHFLKAPLLLW